MEEEEEIDHVVVYHGVNGVNVYKPSTLSFGKDQDRKDFDLVCTVGSLVYLTEKKVAHTTAKEQTPHDSRDRDDDPGGDDKEGNQAYDEYRAHSGNKEGCFHADYLAHDK